MDIKNEELTTEEKAYMFANKIVDSDIRYDDANGDLRKAYIAALSRELQGMNLKGMREFTDLIVKINKRTRTEIYLGY